MADVGRVGGDALGQGPPQVGLPGQVGGKLGADTVGGSTGGPVRQKSRPLGRVGGEQPRDAPGDRVAATSPQLRLVTGGEVAEMGCDGATPGFLQAGINGFQQGPDHRVRRPGIVVDNSEDLGDQRSGGAENDPGADAVVGFAAAKGVREPLAEPALHAALGHEDQLLCEGIRLRRRQQASQPVGK